MFFAPIYLDVPPGKKLQASSEKQNSGWKTNPERERRSLTVNTNNF